MSRDADATEALRDISAGDTFRNTLIPRRNAVDEGGYPMWYGWAIMDAFLAGASFARSESGKQGEALARELETERVKRRTWQQIADQRAIEVADLQVQIKRMEQK